MSYILDALKKSEQQRGHGKTPDVQTVHSSGLNYHDEKKAYWPYILIAAILLNLIAIVYFIIDKNSEKVTAAAEDINTLRQAQVPILNEEINNIANTLKKTRTDNNVPIEPLQSTPTPAQKVTSSSNDSTTIKKMSPPVTPHQEDTQENIVSYYDLPESLQLKIPTITVSAHIYSNNPIQRSIVINNSFLEEGDYVLDDLILLEITVDGAIFDYEGTRFYYAVVSGWQ